MAERHTEPCSDGRAGYVHVQAGAAGRDCGGEVKPRDALREGSVPRVSGEHDRRCVVTRRCRSAAPSSIERSRGACASRAPPKGCGCCALPDCTHQTAYPPPSAPPSPPIPRRAPAAAFFTQTVQVDEDVVKFEIWDTAGQERYHSLAPMYYRGAKAAVIVYDITKSVRPLAPC